MALIDLPAKFRFSKVNSFRLERRTNILRSKFTAHRQVVSLPFAVWYLQAEFVESMMNEQEGRELRAFLAELEGQANTFKLPVPGYFGPSTELTNEVITYGAHNARASQIVLRNVTFSNKPFLKKGDHFTIQDELKIVTKDCDTGNFNEFLTPTLVDFQPPLRKAVAANVPVEVDNPYCLMSAEDDDVADWQIGPPTRQRIKFNAVEAF